MKQDHIYCHPPTDLFAVSQLTCVVKHASWARNLDEFTPAGYPNDIKINL